MVKMVLWWVVEKSSCQNMYGIKSIGGSQPSVKLNQLFPSKFSRTTTRPYHLISALESLHSMSCTKVTSFEEGFLIFEVMFYPSHQQDLQVTVFKITPRSLTFDLFQSDLKTFWHFLPTFDSPNCPFQAVLMNFCPLKM